MPNRFDRWGIAYVTILGVLFFGVVATTISAVFGPEPSPEEVARREKENAAREELEAAEQAERDRKEAAKREAEEAEKRRKEEQKRREGFEEWAGVSGFIGCKEELKSQLKDPGSYRDDWASPEPKINPESQTASYVWRFRAKNSFGGYDTAIAICETKLDSDGLKGFGLPSVTISQ